MFRHDVTDEGLAELKAKFLAAIRKRRLMVLPTDTEFSVTEVDPDMNKLYKDADILNRVAHHPPSAPAIVQAHEEIRSLYGQLAIRMNNLLPEGQLKTTAIDNLLRAMQDANTCVAVEQKLYSWTVPMDGREQEGIAPKLCGCGKPVSHDDDCAPDTVLRCKDCGIIIVDGKHAWPYESQDEHHEPTTD